MNMKGLAFLIFVTVLVALACPCSCRRPAVASSWLFGDDIDNVDYASDELVGAQSFDDDHDHFNFPATADYRSVAMAAARAGGYLNVVDYGAVGNGIADDTQAFKKAWGDLCAAGEGAPTLKIPAGKTFLLRPLQFLGPCRAASVHLQIEGTLMAPKNTKWGGIMGIWLTFSDITNLIIDGSGTINSRGVVWWNAFPRGGSESRSPTALAFHKCNGLVLSGLSHLDSPRNHISISGCNNAMLSKLTIRAPPNSPNTDGIDISSSTNIHIQDSFIATGDDCIAINGGSSKINITGITCGPGHGISIGSLGRGGSYDTVEDVNVANCELRGTTNGARIKTWKGGKGFAKKIVFEHIILDNVRNPIIIDQNYFDQWHNGDNNKDMQLQVSDVTYSDIRGSSSSDVAIVFKCDREVGCNNIVMNDISLFSTVQGKRLTTVCNNAHVIVHNSNLPMTCVPNYVTSGF